MALFDPEFSSLSSDELAELDRICGEFERQRVAGEQCSIEHHAERCLGDAPRPLRSGLVRELIRIDIEIGIEWDEALDIEGYVARFPAHADFIRALFTEASSRTKNKEDNCLLDTPRALDAIGDTPRNGLDTIIRDIDEHRAGSAEAIYKEPVPSRFQVLRNLATGGIGIVYVGLDRDLDREVAIKVLKRKFASVPGVLTRFRTEATITSHLEHPNIVPVYAIGVRNDGLPFYAMRLVRGRSLQQAIQDVHAAVEASESMSLDFRHNPVCRDLLLRFVTACRAAAFAHSRGVIHRDIKPSNIMVDDFGETLLVDWGLAVRKASKQDLSSAENRSSQIVGTPGYMSPEQAAGMNEAIDHRADIYSLGVTLMTLLTKQMPRSPLITGAGTNVALHEGKRIVSPDSRDWLRSSRVPHALQAIVDKATQEDVAQRYSSARQLADDLESWLADEPISVVADSIPVKLRRWMRRHRAIAGGLIAGAVCGAIALVVGMIVLAAQNETLRQANAREQIAMQAAITNASRAESNAAEAVKQRDRMLSVLDRFLIDIERGLASVPGGAKVQRNVLVTVLNELDLISHEFGYQGDADLSNAIALLDLASLFSRVGKFDVALNSKTAELGKGTPLEVAERLAAEAWEIAEKVQSEDLVPLLSVRAQILERQADIYRQTGRPELSLAQLNEALKLREEIKAEGPESIELALAHIATIDQIGQYYLLNKQFDRAQEIFGDTHTRALQLREEKPDDLSVLRVVAIACSRLGDIANGNGDLDAAERWLEEDWKLTERIYEADPEDATAKRDLTVSLDRLGRSFENRGKLDRAVEAFEQSRSLRVELLEAEPSDLRIIRELFVSNFKLGATKMVLKQFEDAKKYYRQADELARQLAEADKASTLAKRYQSMCAESICDILLSESKPDEALPFALLSFKITEEIAALSPLDNNIQEDLFVLHTKIAKVHKLRGDFDACLRELELTLEGTASALEQSNRSLQSLSNHSSILARLGDACLAAKKPQLAVGYLEQMIKNQATIPEAQRQDADSRRLLVNAHSLLGQAFLEIGEPQKAQQSLIAARDLAKAMIAEEMRMETMLKDLEEIEQSLEVCRKKLED